LFCVIAIRLLLWAINSGQYDDLDKEAWRILAEEEPEGATPSSRDDPATPDDNKP
jgi:cbb3-type cytochrome oxidase maturation protein